MRRPFIASKEFWLGVATALICLVLALGLAMRFAG